MTYDKYNQLPRNILKAVGQATAKVYKTSRPVSSGDLIAAAVLAAVNAVNNPSTEEIVSNESLEAVPLTPLETELLEAIRGKAAAKARAFEALEVERKAEAAVADAREDYDEAEEFFMQALRKFEQAANVSGETS
jgi:hypothetical protein